MRDLQTGGDTSMTESKQRRNRLGLSHPPAYGEEVSCPKRTGVVRVQGSAFSPKETGEDSPMTDSKQRRNRRKQRVTLEPFRKYGYHRPGGWGRR